MKKEDVAKKMYKEKHSKLRKSFHDQGYSSVKEKGYYDYSVRERKNIRDNAKPDSNMRKWAGMGNKELKGAYKY